MAFVTTGLTNGGVTAHYKFSYDQSLGGVGGVEPARTNAVIAACEADYALMHGWFGGGVNVTGLNVQVTTQSNGAGWSGSASSSTVQLKAQGASYSNNPAYLRYLIIAEVVEIFMLAQGAGWFQGSNEGSKGEGLSRFLSGQFLAQNGFLGLGIDADYAVAHLWLNSPRQDFVNNAPDDNGYDATNGCTTLFIYYLFSQLGHSINQIVAAGSSTLTGVYKNLTNDSADPFPLFKGLLDLWFPSTTSSAVAGPNFDDPFPLFEAAYTGVWRAGTKPYYLWTAADEPHFLAKWQTLASQNMRLTDIDVAVVGNQALFSGVWEQGTDGYYLWVDADTSHFTAKVTALAAQNLRLVSFTAYNGLWAGAWRQGTDGYYLWVDADQSHFLAKWSALAAQNLRLVDFDTYVVNGQRLWAGVWREGTDGYYIWVDADWAHFTAKWQQLAAQNLRLVGVQTYNGLWAGIWRQGNDAYYLWANVSESDFFAKWQTLQAQNLRLVDMVVAPLNKEGVAGGAMAEALAADAIAMPAPSLAEAPLAALASMGAFGAGSPAYGVGHVIGAGAGNGSGSGAFGEGFGGGSAGLSLVDTPRSGAAMTGHGGGSVETLATTAVVNAEMSGFGGGSVDTTPPTAGAGSSMTGRGGGSVSSSARAEGAVGVGQGGGSVDEPAPSASAAMAGRGGGDAALGAETSQAAGSEMRGRVAEAAPAKAARRK